MRKQEKATKYCYTSCGKWPFFSSARLNIGKSLIEKFHLPTNNMVSSLEIAIHCEYKVK